jgi:hypothetical protein
MSNALKLTVPEGLPFIEFERELIFRSPRCSGPTRNPG